MKNPIALAVVVALAALVLLAAQSTEPKKTPETDALTKALDALAKAQERQAVAWEKLAEKGWPTPTNLTLTGSVPSALSVDLSGTVKLKQADTSWDIRTR